jgi:hypothetical protein
MTDIPINKNPDIDNYRRFKRGWKEGLAASVGQKRPYKDPDKTYGRRQASDMGTTLELQIRMKLSEPGNGA